MLACRFYCSGRKDTLIEHRRLCLGAIARAPQSSVGPTPQVRNDICVLCLHFHAYRVIMGVPHLYILGREPLRLCRSAIGPLCGSVSRGAWRSTQVREDGIFAVSMGSQLTDSFIALKKHPSVLGVWYILNRFAGLPLCPETPRPRRPPIRTSLTALAFHPQHFLPQFLLSTHTAVYQ